MEKTVLSNITVLSLLAALAVLDGDQTNDAGTVTRKSLKLPWRVTYAAARNMSILKPFAESVNKARQQIIANASGGAGSIQETDSKYAEVMKDINDLMELQTTLTVESLHLLAQADMEALDLPPSVVSSLLIIFKD